MSKLYMIVKDGKFSIYTTWKSVSRQVNHYFDTVYKSFKKEQTKRFLTDDQVRNVLTYKPRYIARTYNSLKLSNHVVSFLIVTVL